MPHGILHGICLKAKSYRGHNEKERLEYVLQQLKRGVLAGVRVGKARGSLHGTRNKAKKYHGHMRGKVEACAAAAQGQRGARTQM